MRLDVFPLNVFTTTCRPTGRFPVTVRQAFFCALSAVAVLSLCGCETVSGSHPVTLVRVIDASYHPDAYDAYIGSTPIAINFAGPSVSNYAFQPPGVTTVNIVPTGKHNVVAQ